MKTETKQIKLPIKVYNKLKKVNKKDEFFWQTIDRLIGDAL